jgi:hypothetical protein
VIAEDVEELVEDALADEREQPRVEMGGLCEQGAHILPFVFKSRDSVSFSLTLALDRA